MTISNIKSPIYQTSPSDRGEILVRVEGVSKKFCRSLKKSLWYGVKDIAHELNPFTGSRENRRSKTEDPQSTISILQSTNSTSLRDDEFWAVNDVSFELRRGECLGLIGHNGAGKTTLLKMLNGLIKPDTGSIEMRGRVGALIALGAGFNPILSGRENIYVNASIIGLKRNEIDKRIDEIIDFAEIGEFIDAPVQSYSSGMQVRLGFAVATALKPDVLILDEVLAVGDTSFQGKCLKRIGDMRSQGTAMIFVSHNEHQISVICDRGLVLNKGCQIALCDVATALNIYAETRKFGTKQNEIEKWAQEGWEIELINFESEGSHPRGRNFEPNVAFSIILELVNPEATERTIIVDCRIVSGNETITQCSSDMLCPLRLTSGKSTLKIEVGGISFQDAALLLNIAMWCKQSRSILAWSRGHSFQISKGRRTSGKVDSAISFSIDQKKT